MSFKLVLCVAFIFTTSAFGQEQADCFGTGSIVGAVLGTFFGTLLLVAAAYFVWKLYWKSRKGKHLVFSTDPESVKDEFAFDNPGFRQEEARQGWQHEAPTLPIGGKNYALHAEFTKPEGLTAAVSKDDLHLQKPRVRRVKLWARDFTGLGLRCAGGAREGVKIHSVLRNGPAAAAGLQPGDKIKSIKIEFNGTPLEDAVGIISLASPYPVELEIAEGGRVGSDGDGKGTFHPLLRRAGSTGDVNTLEKEGKLLHPPKSPNTSHSNNSTLETKHSRGGIKKMITDKMITTTLERNKKDKKDSTLERENEKNNKLANKSRLSDIPALGKPERNKIRYSSGAEVQVIQPEYSAMQVENAETQKREYDPKRGMKFGIRVLPPNIPDDGILKQNKNIENGVVTFDETDKAKEQRPTEIRHENESEFKTKPIVAKRREKTAPPVPNIRLKSNYSSDSSQDQTKLTDISNSTFSRSDLNSSGIKRDENGIPQEIPQHMLEAAIAARSNRKSPTDINAEDKPDNKKEVEFAKVSKKSKGKAPSPPENDKNKTDEIILQQLKNVNDFLDSEKLHSSILHDSFFLIADRTAKYDTSTPKVQKIKSISGYDESINFTQEDIDDIVTKPFKRESDSLNNFYEDTKSNLSSNHDGHSFVSNSDKSDKGSTTIELNNSDITVHSSPVNTINSDENNDENERKAASLGDLSRFELRVKGNIPTGTLERAQSLDISADDTEIKENVISPKKRKANSVVEATFFESDDVLSDMIEDKGVILKHKEPRLSLNIAKAAAMEGLNTFQRNRLKKGSEFGNLEDAIVKGSGSSIDFDKIEVESKPIDRKHEVLSKDNDDDSHETSDHLAKRIMDENLKMNYKLVSEFAKSTSDGSNMSSLESTHDLQVDREKPVVKYDEKINIYDTNIPDDLKVSRNTLVNSLERPKSDMMKKLLAKNPVLNVHIDQKNESTSTRTEIDTPMTDASKSASMHHPDIVNFDLKTDLIKQKDYDDFVSNIRVGSNNSSLNYDKRIYDAYWADKVPNDIRNNNIVTISTDERMAKETQPKFTKSIEIGETRHIPDVIEGAKHINKNNTETVLTREGKTLYMEPQNVAITMTEEPLQKTVTVNVTEDEFGNKVITQNVEKISTQYITTKGVTPLQVEQVTFGVLKNPTDIDELNLEEEGEKDIDKKVLKEIKKQNPELHFTTDEPSFSKTETIILNTRNLDEQEALALMEKFKNNPEFMSQKTPEELSKLGIRVIHDLEETENVNNDAVEITKTSYSINPTAFDVKRDNDKNNFKNHITEIQVLTPRSEKEKRHTEPILTYELDVSVLDDFIANERYHTARELEQKQQPKKRHSDFDLPRNSHIKFRTATYESPKGTLVTSTDLENKRLSQLDQIRTSTDKVDSSSKPAISAKPSNIPVKSPEKKPASTSKIPVFMSQKSLSQENLMDKNYSLPRSPPPKLMASTSSGNISVTSIKSSSKHPSGK